MGFSYVGCQKAVGLLCDQCAGRPRYFHTLRFKNGAERGVCRTCAGEMLIPGHRKLPAIAEARCKAAGGKFVRVHIGSGQ
jgi:hypothetical protein